MATSTEERGTPWFSPEADTAPAHMRDRILEAAVEIFAARGFEACTMRDLAAAVGIKAPGLYSHFASKEAILTEAITRILNDFLDHVSAPVESTEPEARLEATVRRHVLYQVKNLHVAMATDQLLNKESTRRFLPDEDFDFLVKVQRSYFELVRSRVRQAVGDESLIDPTVAALGIISMCDRVTTWFDPAGRLSPEQLADHYWQLVRSMLKLDHPRP